MSLIQSFDVESDFWSQNPQVQYMDPFSELYPRKDSSRIMWAIALYRDPSKGNKMYRIRDHERLEQIKKNYLNNKYENFETEFSNIIDAYQQTILSKVEREYNNLWKKAEERQELLETTPYSLDIAEKLDRIMLNTEKIWSMLKKIEDDMIKDESSENWAGYKESGLESGAFF